ncbi:hypothetical protein [Kitasatospora purpeofusca]|uniref:hypothetical protein n=1 Tax=Kitasatospora purpeofusca TaxID=67352 RepID=UPI003868365D|nr:hypothetical protein OIP63_09055 [Kitasatospora purpeofusca]
MTNYGKCLGDHGLTVELSGGAVFVSTPGGQAAVDAARAGCRGEQGAYGKSVTKAGEGSHPGSVSQYDFQARLGMCLKREGLEPHDRADPVFFDSGSNEAVAVARWCIANNMLPKAPRSAGAQPSGAGGASVQSTHT